MNKILFLVVPCYNEEESLPNTIISLKKKLRQLISQNKVSDQSRILFVDDGSRDDTWKIIEKSFEQDKICEGLKLAHNSGHQAAVLAGLLFAKEYADVIISIDADLQQDIEAIDLFLEKYDLGAEIVYGVRNSRDTDSGFKKFTALGFYKLMKILGCDVLKNHADYRLMSKQAVNTLAQYKEVNLFLRGLIPLIGFTTDIVYFDVFPRKAGSSKYPFKKMLAFALDGITSLSVKPLQAIIWLGVILLGLSILMLVCLIITSINKVTNLELSIILASVWAVGGLVLLSIGIVGEYIGKIYFETKARPRYNIETILHKGGEKD